MKTELNEIVERFIDEYKNEIENDKIYISTVAEWWIKICDEYGYVGMESIAIGYKVEKMILDKIHDEFKPTYQTGGIQYVKQCIERNEPIMFSFKYTNHQNRMGCDYSAGEEIIWATSRNVFIDLIKDITKTSTEVLFDIHLLVEKGMIRLPERYIEMIKEENN